MRSWSKVLVVVSFLALSNVASGQISYPSFQPPSTTEREFNFGLASARRATTLVAQWREGFLPGNQFSLDFGFTDVDQRDVNLILLLGAQYAYELVTATPESPLDVLFTVGFFAQVGDSDRRAASVPVGASVGHKFQLDDALAIAPYVHPRFSLDFINSDTELNINVDFGVSVDFARQFGLRVATTLGDVETVGLSLVWRPLGLVR